MKPINPPCSLPKTTRITTSFPDLGPMVVTTDVGPCLARDAPGIMTFVVNRDCHCGRCEPGPPSIAVMVYDPIPMRGKRTGFGVVVQMAPDDIREIAASLLAMADEIDPQTRQ